VIKKSIGDEASGDRAIVFGEVQQYNPTVITFAIPPEQFP
jgi:hypothetical protein